LERSEIIFIKTIANAAARNTLLEKEKISVFSRTKGKRKKENTTVNIKKNLIMK
jgi:hypothetical protein